MGDDGKMGYSLALYGKPVQAGNYGVALTVRLVDPTTQLPIIVPTSASLMLR